MSTPVAVVGSQAKYLSVRHDLRDKGRELCYLEIVVVVVVVDLLLFIVIIMINPNNDVCRLLESERERLSIRIDDHRPAARACNHFTDIIV